MELQERRDCRGAARRAYDPTGGTGEKCPSCAQLEASQTVVADLREEVDLLSHSMRAQG